MSEDLELRIKQVIVEALMLEDVKPEDIETDAPLFVEGLGLDSIDALESGPRPTTNAIGKSSTPLPAWPRSSDKSGKGNLQRSLRTPAKRTRKASRGLWATSHLSLSGVPF